MVALAATGFLVVVFFWSSILVCSCLGHQHSMFAYSYGIKTYSYQLLPSSVELLELQS